MGQASTTSKMSQKSAHDIQKRPCGIVQRWLKVLKCLQAVIESLLPRATNIQLMKLPQIKEFGDPFGRTTVGVDETKMMVQACTCICTSAKGHRLQGQEMCYHYIIFSILTIYIVSLRNYRVSTSQVLIKVIKV